MSSRPPLLLEKLIVRDLRNLRHLELEPARKLTVLTGANGHGKTSVLEAIYLAATSKSFRAARLEQLVRHGAERSTVEARFRDGPEGRLSRVQQVSLQGNRRSLRMDEKPPESLASFATRSPVICFHAEELQLSQGPAVVRRTVLDRVALFLSPMSADDRARYQRAMQARSRALQQEGPQGPSVGPFEQLAASYGARLTEARARAAAVLSAHVLSTLARLSPELALSLRYAPGGSVDPRELQQELERRRPLDRIRGAGSYGPHRDDLVLSLDGRLARQVASQGQHRALTLALKLGELEAVAEASGKIPLLLLDDLSSELDRERLRAVLTAITELGAQALLTTTRVELIETPRLASGERVDLLVHEGALGALVS